MALKCADISHTTKAQHLHLAWTDRVSEEFFCQGDDEKQHGLLISPGLFFLSSLSLLLSLNIYSRRTGTYVLLLLWPFFCIFIFFLFLYSYLFSGMNRDEVNVCKSQVGFLTFLARPLYQVFFVTVYLF